MERLINDLLDVARIDAGTFVVDKTPIDLPTLLREAIEQHSPLATDKGIRLQMTAPADLLIDADRHRLMQVMANLIGNAIKFTPEGGVITVSCGQRRSGRPGRRHRFGPRHRRREPAPRLRPLLSNRRAQRRRRLGPDHRQRNRRRPRRRIGVDSQPGQGARFWFELPTRPELSEAAAVA